MANTLRFRIDREGVGGGGGGVGGGGQPGLFK